MDSNETEVAQLPQMPYLFCDIHGPVQPAVPGTMSAPPACPTCSTLLTAAPGPRWKTRLEALSRLEAFSQSDASGHDNARTRAKQGAFLAAYAENSRVDLAAKSAGIARSTHYEWMKTDQQYPALFAEAEELAAQTLLDEAVRRGRDGWDEPVTIAGEAKTVRRYSDRLMERLLEAKFPVMFRSNLAHRLVDDKGKDRDVIDFSALDKLIRAADARDGGTSECVPIQNPGNGNITDCKKSPE